MCTICAAPPHRPPRLNGLVGPAWSGTRVAQGCVVEPLASPPPGAGGNRYRHSRLPLASRFPARLRTSSSLLSPHLNDAPIIPDLTLLPPHFPAVTPSQSTSHHPPSHHPSPTSKSLALLLSLSPSSRPTAAVPDLVAAWNTPPPETVCRVLDFCCPCRRQLRAGPNTHAFVRSCRGCDIRSTKFHLSSRPHLASSFSAEADGRRRGSNRLRKTCDSLRLCVVIGPPPTPPPPPPPPLPPGALHHLSWVVHSPLRRQHPLA
ncbi:hypothetical protein CDD83_8347 [Cordyceps sp. RAO-2017]|nr:hypothetical protein CDD83_8347 [Cordyceps sp. RAO-2017]